jgi:VWFA-related protein
MTRCWPAKATTRPRAERVRLEVCLPRFFRYGCLIVCFAAASASKAQVPTVPAPQINCYSIIAEPAEPRSSVRLLASDRSGQPVTDLRPEEVRVTWSKQERKVLSLTPIKDLPRAVGLFFDASGSRRSDKLLPKEVDGVLAFLDSVWRSEDTGLVIEFAERAVASARPTHDLQAIGVALQGYKDEAASFRGSTALYDALCSVRAPRPSATIGEKLFVVVSDFGDNSSRQSAEMTIEALKKEGVRIFPLLIETDPNPRPREIERSRKVAKQFAAETGGEVFRIEKEKDLSLAFEQLKSDLRGTYRLTFDSVPDSKEKRLEVASTRPNTRLLVATD